ncbi:MAG: 2-C-methyl-D-erythritol 2,4-cyclodiphosphate synthase [Chloroflexota bacterium]|nr:2-C-methyl-D-erythritol 2,4-cyclodiphosphate synthase [Chloroflexota bacterium]
MRVGFGYDVHPLRPGRDLVIGGVHIDNPLGLDGHSDADVLTHAVIDSLLGAAALGDIGQHFPASDPGYQGASSQDLLAMVVRTVRQAGYRVVNVDSTIVAEEPRLQPHIEAMRKQLATTLGIDLGEVSVKATSPEGLGALGREEGIAAHAVALIEATG